MEIIDHYSILGVGPSATIQEIKTAYRSLAKRFHPDKNQGDPYAAARFTAIKEAYEVLTDPAKKEYYLQKRWYNQSIGKRRTGQVITPENMIRQALELERYVSRLDIFRMDQQGLAAYITDLLSDEAIEKLNIFADIPANDEIGLLLAEAARPLQALHLPAVKNQLAKLNTSPAAREKINKLFNCRHQQHQRQQWEPWIILLATILTCLFIYFMSR